MAFIPIPNGIRVCLRFAKDGQQVCNVFHVKAGAANPTTSDLQAVGALFENWWDTVLQPMLSNFVTLQAIEVRDASAQGAEGIDVPVNEAGAVSNTALPNNVTIAIKLLTGFAGRAFRGRSFYPGLALQHLATQNTVTTATQAAFLAAWGALRTQLDAGGYPLCVASKQLNGTLRTTGVLTEVTDVDMDTTLDSQRRRLPGRGK